MHLKQNIFVTYILNTEQHKAIKRETTGLVSNAKSLGQTNFLTPEHVYFKAGVIMLQIISIQMQPAG